MRRLTCESVRQVSISGHSHGEDGRRSGTFTCAGVRNRQSGRTNFALRTAEQFVVDDLTAERRFSPREISVRFFDSVVRIAYSE